MKKVTVKQDEQNPIPTEIIAQSIIEIANGMKKIRSGRLNDSAIVTLIFNATTGIQRRDIQTVMETISDLERVYIKAAK